MKFMGHRLRERRDCIFCGKKGGHVHPESVLEALRISGSIKSFTPKSSIQIPTLERCDVAKSYAHISFELDSNGDAVTKSARIVVPDHRWMWAKRVLRRLREIREEGGSGSI